MKLLYFVFILALFQQDNCYPNLPRELMFCLPKISIDLNDQFDNDEISKMLDVVLFGNVEDINAIRSYYLLNNGSNYRNEEIHEVEGELLDAKSHCSGRCHAGGSHYCNCFLGECWCDGYPCDSRYGCKTEFWDSKLPIQPDECNQQNVYLNEQPKQC